MDVSYRDNSFIWRIATATKGNWLATATKENHVLQAFPNDNLFASQRFQIIPREYQDPAHETPRGAFGICIPCELNPPKELEPAREARRRKSTICTPCKRGKSRRESTRRAKRAGGSLGFPFPVNCKSVKGESLSISTRRAKRAGKTWNLPYR